MSRWLVLSCVLAAGLVPVSRVAAQLQPVGTQIWLQSSPGIGIAPSDAADFASVLATGDFNCDGFHDAAIGAPGGVQLIDAEFSGQVLVLYSAGGNTGLSATMRQLWSQASTGLASDPSPSERFGAALASGDFDNDGCDDLAIGVPRDDVDGVDAAGSVQVLYGTAAEGLTASSSDYWTQAPLSTVGGIGGALEANDRFGSALAVGDFDDDGFDDLAIGAPGEDLANDLGANVSNAGMVQMLFGHPTGLRPGSEDLALRRGTTLPGAPQTSEDIGAVLAAGDIFDILPGTELVIGIPNYVVAPNLTVAGAVMVAWRFGGPVGTRTYTQGAPGVLGVAAGGDQFGAALAVGDFDGDGLDEIAVGAPGEDFPGGAAAGSLAGQGSPVFDAGAVIIINPGGEGAYWVQDDLPPEQSESSDRFGSTLLAADFNGDGIDELAIGVIEGSSDFAQFDNFAGDDSIALVHVLQGSQGIGLTATKAQILSYALGPPTDEVVFESILAAGPINAGAAADLIIGEPYGLVAEGEAGSATVVYSLAPDGLFADGFEAP